MATVILISRMGFYRTTTLRGELKHRSFPLLRAPVNLYSPKIRLNRSMIRRHPLSQFHVMHSKSEGYGEWDETSSDMDIMQEAQEAKIVVYMYRRVLAMGHIEDGR